MSSARSSIRVTIRPPPRIDSIALDEELPEPVEIPHTALAADVLRRVIESFVLREGTEYGARDVSLEAKVADVTRQLERGEARILFDPTSITLDIVPAPKSKRHTLSNPR
jgi:uncharacterized protein